MNAALSGSRRTVASTICGTLSGSYGSRLGRGLVKITLGSLRGGSLRYQSPGAASIAGGGPAGQYALDAGVHPSDDDAPIVVPAKRCECPEPLADVSCACPVR